MHFGHESRAITMLFLNEIIPLAILYHSSLIPMSVQCICKILLKFVSSPIPMSMQSLKKIGKKILKLEHGNEAQSIFDIHQGP